MTARFLLLLALVGTFLPLALSATAPSTHACCLRAVHHCHTSESQQRSINGVSSCGHNCCRAVTTSQTAHPKPAIAVNARQLLGSRPVEPAPGAFRTNYFSFASPRAPPATSLT